MLAASLLRVNRLPQLRSCRVRRSFISWPGQPAFLTGAARPAARAEAARCARDDRDAAGKVLATAKPTAKKRTKGDKIEEEDDDEKRGGRERCERRDLHLLQSTLGRASVPSPRRSSHHTPHSSLRSAVKH